MKKTVLLMTALALAALAAPAASHAQSETPAASLDASEGDASPDSEAKKESPSSDADDLGMLGKEALELARAGKWFALLGTAMLLLVALFRRFLLRRFDWFQTRLGGYAVAGGVTLLTIAGLAMKVGISVDVIAAGLSAGGIAVSLHETSKDLKNRSSG